MTRRATLTALLLGCILPVSIQAAEAPAPLPRTGQTNCYKTTGAGDGTDCAGTGQDGDTRTGLAWPEPRFTDKSGPVLTDRLTGLAWSADADPGGEAKTWRLALDFIRSLNRENHLGHADWRLPNVNELKSLGNKARHPSAWLDEMGFRNARADDYWTSTTYAAYPNCAWTVGMYSGIVSGRAKSDAARVWPVRDGGRGLVPLPKTGQARCYDESGASVDCAGSGQDGELQAGAAWPSPRFTENGDRTMTDRLTGLVWCKDGNTPGPPACGPGKRKNGQDALDHVRCLDSGRFLGRGDWRLPNIAELSSLLNYGQSGNAAWLVSQGFSDVQPGPYWSSTTYAATPWNAWGVNMRDGAESSFARKHDINVWPVR